MMSPRSSHRSPMSGHRGLSSTRFTIVPAANRCSRRNAPAGLAEHRFAAGEWAAACGASIAAARGSMRLYSMHAAHAHLQRAVDAHRRAANTCVHPTVDDADLYKLAADAAFLVGELESV